MSEHDEEAAINAMLDAVQDRYPSLTREELRQIFDETYDLLTTKEPE